MIRILTLLLMLLITPGAAAAADAASTSPEVRRDIEYGNHGGERLSGDLYLPTPLGRHPALVAVHGGDWAFADSRLYQYWGPWLAERGYAVFAINYRLLKKDRNRYPAAVTDVRAAIQFLRSHADELAIDPDRIGLMGDSAGAHLASLTALSGDEPLFANRYPDDPYSGVKAAVKVCIAVYGIYDLAAQWNNDRSHNPEDNIAEAFLGAALPDDRRLYFDASPLSYATRPRNHTAFLLAWGTGDDRVDPHTQSEAFAQALAQAGFPLQTAIIPGAPHYWASDPITPGHYPAVLAPKLLEFLQKSL